MAGLRLTPGEWQALTLAVGIFKGQNQYMAKDGNSFEQMLPNVESLIEKLEGTQLLTYGCAQVRIAVDSVAESEVRLQRKLDGKAK